MNHLNIKLEDLPYAVEEAMNRLRINIKFSGKHTKKILITSSLPNEGKSTIAIQLWRMLAEAGFPTVFVDTDLRKSVLKDRCEMSSNEKIEGIDYYISGMCEYEDVVYETNIDNGYFVPCTQLLENPSTLFEDVRFKELLDRLSDDYRYIIIDSAPLALVADAALIGSMCDGTVLVVRAGDTPRVQIRNSIHQIEQTGKGLLGVVLNRVEMNGHSYRKYYGKYQKYGNYYTYGAEETVNK